MTVPPDDSDPDRVGSAESAEPEPEASDAREPIPGVDFDPYRFGKPDHPVPPEFAPPGYPAEAQPATPPPPPPPGWPPPSGPSQPFGYTPGPPGPAPPPGPASPFSRYGAPRATNGKATAAMVLGILSIVFSWLLIWDLLLIVPAIVIGLGARKDAQRFPERGGRTAATTGIVCAIVAAALVVALSIYTYNRVKPCLDEFGIGSKQFQTCATNRLF